MRGGIEASIHAMRKKFEDEDTEAILLVDASNAFNALIAKLPYPISNTHVLTLQHLPGTYTGVKLSSFYQELRELLYPRKQGQHRVDLNQ